MENPKQDHSLLTGLKNYWFLAAAIVTVSVAWGQAQTKIQSLEEAIKENANTRNEVLHLRSQMDRSEERTKAIIESQARQERMIELLLSNAQRNQIKRDTDNRSR